MGAQLIESIKEVIFTNSEDSLLVTLCDGRMLELHGDGFVQELMAGGVIVDAQL